jgi:hypothetical protein
MKTLCSFLTKFASIISWSLSCFDRVIFKGHLPISRPFQMENFIDYTLKIRRCDFFKKTGPQWSHRLVDHAKGFAAKYDRPFERRAGKVDKDAWAKQQLRDKPRVETVINQPGDFKVFRECQHRDGKVSMGWYPMCKGVGNLPHYQKHALASK